MRRKMEIRGSRSRSRLNRKATSGQNMYPSHPYHDDDHNGEA